MSWRLRSSQRCSRNLDLFSGTQQVHASFASPPAGLDRAILGGINAEAGEKADAKRIAALLKHGAHALGATEERAQAASSDFANEVLSAPPRLIAPTACHATLLCG